MDFQLLICEIVFFHCVRQFYCFFIDYFLNISVTGEAMGVMQHHDAVSGTERQHVADDYVQRLSQGVDAALVSNKKTRIKSFHLTINTSNKFIITIFIVFTSS